MSAARDRRFDPFRILSADERAAHLADYLVYLRERDGEIRLDERCLARRELRFAERACKPVEWTGAIDLEGFHRNMREGRGPEVDARTTWLLATSKANLGEAYGVEIELSYFFAHPEAVERADPLYVYLMLQESYHTRLLAEICRTCGLEPEPGVPALLNRVAVHLMTQLPERVRWAPILAGEVLGSEVFKMLAEGAELFDAQPEVAERLRALLHEIWIDEVFHVAYLRAKIGPWGVRAAKRLLPLVAWSVMHDVPQLHRLGWTRQTVLSRLRRGIELPDDVDWMAPDPV